MQEKERLFQTELEILHAIQDGRPHPPKEVREKVEAVLRERGIPASPDEIRQAFWRMYNNEEISITKRAEIVWPHQ